VVLAQEAEVGHDDVRRGAPGVPNRVLTPREPPGQPEAWLGAEQVLDDPPERVGCDGDENAQPPHVLSCAPAGARHQSDKCYVVWSATTIGRSP
jgi:hypothetical protein